MNYDPARFQRARQILNRTTGEAARAIQGAYAAPLAGGNRAATAAPPSYPVAADENGDEILYALYDIDPYDEPNYIYDPN